MTRKAQGKADPIKREIELTSSPGAFIPDHACFYFVSNLEAVAAKIVPLIDGDPARAVTLHGAFLAEGADPDETANGKRP